MDLKPYIENLHRQVENAAEAAGEEARAVAGRLLAPLDSAIRLTLQDALTAAADEITTALAPGSVEVRLRGRDPEFVVTPPPPEDDFEADDAAAMGDAGTRPAWAPREGEEGSISRINLRLPDHLKARIERAAGAEGLSVNAWLVRASAAQLERNEGSLRRDRRPPQGPQRYTGWVR